MHECQRLPGLPGRKSKYQRVAFGLNLRVTHDGVDVEGGREERCAINKGAPSHTSFFWGSTDIQNLFDGGVQIFRTIALCTHSAAAAHFFRWFSDPQARCVCG